MRDEWRKYWEEGPWEPLLLNNGFIECHMCGCVNSLEFNRAKDIRCKKCKTGWSMGYFGDE